METIITGNKEKRKAGVLLPIFSLPGNGGIGTLGKEAYRFVDWLKKAKMKVWQVLPLLPTNYGDSPYQSCASDALNFYFIDFDSLAAEKLLEKSDYENLDWGDPSRVDYGKLFAWKANVLKIAFSRFNADTGSWKSFLKAGKYRDFAVFMAIKTKFGYRPWTEWDEPYKTYDENVIKAFEKENEKEIEFWQFTQYLFLKQWNRLKEYANARGVSIMGDMPIYVAYDSVETWKYRKDLFMLNEDGNPALRAGVPPDAFSDDGQLWGNPVYDWEKMKTNGYDWWKKRIDYAFTLFDIVRIDHFRGFDRFYTVAEGSETAKLGEWRKGPGAELFVGLEEKSIVAEDLGVIDDGVREMMKETGYPGMKVLSFGFDGNPDNEHKASNHPNNAYAYTGTHDNAPVRAMLEEFDEDRLSVFLLEMKIENERLGLEFNLETEDTVTALCENLLEQLFASPACVAIMPLQDVLMLGAESRINEPSTVGKNWTFRFKSEDISDATAKKLANLAKKYNR
jgi:4-alpha-glucanotransferase